MSPEKLLRWIIALSLIGICFLMYDKSSAVAVQRLKNDTIADPDPDCKTPKRHRYRPVSAKQATPKIVEHTLVFHSKTTKFLNPAVGLTQFDSVKGLGLFVKSDIKAGEILFVEYPLLRLDDGATHKIADGVLRMRYIQQLLQSSRDPELSRIWLDHIDFNADMYHLYRRQWRHIPLRQLGGLHDLVKVESNLFGAMTRRRPRNVYALLSRINQGLPQNVAAIFGEKRDYDVCVVMATTDIAKHSELVSDYLFDWFRLKQKSVAPFLEHYFQQSAGEIWRSALWRRNLWRRRDIYLAERKSVGAGFGFDENEKWMRILEALNSESTSSEQKYRIASEQIYPNGLVGKQSGEAMELVRGGLSRTAAQIRELVDSRRLFNVLVGEGAQEPPAWTGQQFVESAKVWRDNAIRWRYIVSANKF